MSKVIGHTRSGKAIYSAAAMYRGYPGVYGDLLTFITSEVGAHIAKTFRDYTIHDHLDAAELHQAMADKIKVPKRYDAGGKGNQQYRHIRAADGHREACSLIAAIIPAPAFTYEVQPTRKHAVN
jgi:hypothetical protein